MGTGKAQKEIACHTVTVKCSSLFDHIKIAFLCKQKSTLSSTWLSDTFNNTKTGCEANFIFGLF